MTIFAKDFTKIMKPLFQDLIDVLEKHNIHTQGEKEVSIYMFLMMLKSFADKRDREEEKGE